MIHYLKTESDSFPAVRANEKRVELRQDDRGYSVGDILVLREYKADARAFTGRRCLRFITNIYRGPHGLLPGFAALSVRPLQFTEKTDALEAEVKAACA